MSESIELAEHRYIELHTQESVDRRVNQRISRMHEKGGFTVGSMSSAPAMLCEESAATTSAGEKLTSAKRSRMSSMVSSKNPLHQTGEGVRALENVHQMDRVPSLEGQL